MKEAPSPLIDDPETARLKNRQYNRLLELLGKGFDDLRWWAPNRVGTQWTPEEREELAKQDHPPLTFNKIGGDWKI